MNQDISRIFGMAVNREQAAYAFYHAVAEKAKNSSVCEIFRELAEDEKGHRDLLLGLKGDPALGHKFDIPPADYKVSETELTPPLTLDMMPRDAIALAMKKEEEAVTFYRSLSAAAAEPATRAVFEKLANMELGHKLKLETVFVDIGYPEVF